MKKLTRRLTAVAAVTTAAVTFTGVGMAHAATIVTAFPDPAQGLTYNLVGSETMQDVMGALTQGYAADPHLTNGEYNGHTYTADAFGKTVGSWNAINPSSGATYDNITPVAGGDTFARPNGSGDGRNALSAANNPSKDTFVENGVTQTLATAADRQQEVSIARSSSLPSQTLWTNNGAANDLTFFPVAKDAVGIAERAVGTGVTVPNFYTGALTAIYTGGSYTHTAGTNTVGDVFESGGYPFVVTSVNKSGTITGSEQVVPVLQQASSGTRSFFQGATATTSFSAAIVANETGTVAQEENNANADLSTADVQAALNLASTPYTAPTNGLFIVDFSGAQVIEQEHGLTDNTLSGSGWTAFFPTINNQTLTNGQSGVNAGVGTLQSGTPEITFGQSLVGNFARYVFLALPSSEVTTAGASSEAALQKWVDQTVPSETVPWDDFGFATVSVTGVSDSPSFWITTAYTN